MSNTNLRMQFHPSRHFSGEIPSKTQLGFVTFIWGVRQSLRQQGVDFDPSVHGSWAFHGADYESLCSILRVPEKTWGREKRWTWISWIWMNMIRFGTDMSWYHQLHFYDVLCWCIVSLSFAVLIVVGFLMFPRSLDLYLYCLIRLWDVYLRAASVSWGRNPLHNSYFNFQCWKLEMPHHPPNHT